MSQPLSIFYLDGYMKTMQNFMHIIKAIFTPKTKKKNKLFDLTKFYFNLSYVSTDTIVNIKM